MMRRNVVASFVLLACSVSGLWNCASSGTSRIIRKSAFTKPEDLARIQAKPVADVVLQDDGLRVERWELTGPLPRQVALVGIQGAQDKFEGALLDAVAQSSNKTMRASESMRCAAREMGEFALQNQMKSPSQSIRDFIRHRCGSVSASLASWHYSWDLEDGATLTVDRIRDDFFEELTQSIKDNYAKAGPLEIGVWFGQRGDKAILEIASGRRRVDLEAFPMVPTAGDMVVIQGELLTRADRLGDDRARGIWRRAVCDGRERPAAQISRRVSHLAS